MKRAGDGRERGFVLLIVLWSVGLLAFLGTQIGFVGRTGLALAANLRGGAAAEAAADGAVHEAAFRLLGAGGPAWSADGTPRRLRAGAIEVELRLTDLGGRIDPNAAPAPLLRAMALRAGLEPAAAEALAEAVIEWRSLAPPAPSMGGALARYRAAGRAWGPAHAPFRDVEELGLVEGMSPGLLERLRPHLGLHLEGLPVPELADGFVLDALTEALKATPDGSLSAAAIALPVIAVTATAVGPDRSRFTRNATIRLRGAAEDGSAPRLFDILSWD